MSLLITQNRGVRIISPELFWCVFLPGMVRWVSLACLILDSLRVLLVSYLTQLRNFTFLLSGPVRKIIRRWYSRDQCQRTTARILSQNTCIVVFKKILYRKCTMSFNHVYWKLNYSMQHIYWEVLIMLVERGHIRISVSVLTLTSSVLKNI